jgi:hypothetical protein
MPVWIDTSYKIVTQFSVKSSVFYDIMPCSLLKISCHFGGTCFLHIQGGRVSQARSQMKYAATLNGIGGVVTQKIEFLITTAVRTSNPTPSNLITCVCICNWNSVLLKVLYFSVEWRWYNLCFVETNCTLWHSHIFIWHSGKLLVFKNSVSLVWYVENLINWCFAENSVAYKTCKVEWKHAQSWTSN